jgi:hypothetical protein
MSKTSCRGHFLRLQSFLTKTFSMPVSFESPGRDQGEVRIARIISSVQQQATRDEVFVWGTFGAHGTGDNNCPPQLDMVRAGLGPGELRRLCDREATRFLAANDFQPVRSRDNRAKTTACAANKPVTERARGPTLPLPAAVAFKPRTGAVPWAGLFNPDRSTVCNEFSGGQPSR